MLPLARALFLHPPSPSSPQRATLERSTCPRRVSPCSRGKLGSAVSTLMSGVRNVSHSTKRKSPGGPHHIQFVRWPFAASHGEFCVALMIQKPCPAITSKSLLLGRTSTSVTQRSERIRLLSEAATSRIRRSVHCATVTTDEANRSGACESLTAIFATSCDSQDEPRADPALQPHSGTGSHTLVLQACSCRSVAPSFEIRVRTLPDGRFNGPVDASEIHYDPFLRLLERSSY